MAASYRRGFRRRKEGGMVRRMVSTLTVTEDEADIRLDRWFRRHFPGVTQGAIQKLCRTGQVRVDGHRADAATRLAAGPVGASPAAARRSAAQTASRRRWTPPAAASWKGWCCTGTTT